MPEIRELDGDDEELEETLSERLWGLTEMFPESAREKASVAFDQTWRGCSSLVKFLRSAVWIVATSTVVLSAPVIFEMERVNLDLARKQEEQQMLFGSGVPQQPGPFGSVPPSQRPQ